ncbi:MAG: class I SAM-dependent methyltransferase [Acidobacteriota bacterium]|nr:class I SAM-dependent methyltransferase [Acidobacteriota bacterium]
MRQPSAPGAHSRPSHGLDQFFSSISDLPDLNILDLAGATQANISFITNLGHRLYSDDILRSMDDAFGRESDFMENQSDRQRVEQFLSQTMDFPDAKFDGALVWDTLQFLTPPVLQLTIERLFRVLRPGAALLAFFHAEEKANVIPVYSYRIADSKTLSLTPKGQRKPAQFFNNRSLEKLFHQFSSVKFFLARDHLREVIVKR